VSLNKGLNSDKTSKVFCINSFNQRSTASIKPLLAHRQPKLLTDFAVNCQHLMTSRQRRCQRSSLKMPSVHCCL